MKLFISVAAALVAFAGVAHAAPVQPTNLVTNGDFEDNGGTGELAGGITSLAGWTQGATVDGNAAAFNFILNDQADSTGFKSVFSDTYTPSKNIKLWGPANGVNNGFTGSPSGGYFFGSDGAYAQAPISQVINGLTIGKTYTLSFDYAASQFTDATGATTSHWIYSFAPAGDSTTYQTSLDIPSQGFSGWQTETRDFVATAASQTLTFLARGTPNGLPPVSLLDNVKILPVDGNAGVPEPANWALLVGGFGLVGGAMRSRRKAAVRLA